MRYVLLTLAAVFLVGTASLSEAALLGHYEFDDPADLGLDSAGGDNNGTALGSDVSAGAGRVGAGSLAIDGTGIGLELASPETFQPLTTFTITSFIKPDMGNANWGNGGSVGRVFGALGIDADGNAIPGTSNSGYGFGVINDGRLRYTTYGVKDFNQPATVVSDQWQHIAVVVVEGDATFYLDGSNIGTVTDGRNANTTSNPYHIGASAISNSDRFVGLIDDLRVYDVALSDEDISALATIPEPSTVCLLGLAVAGLGLSRRRRG